MKEECLICKAPLEYLEKDILMECEICHKNENSKTRCINGHYVCNDCHTQGLDTIIGLCMKESSKNPIAIVEKMMSILSAIDFVKEHFGIAMEKSDIICSYSSLNNQCIGNRCPFSKVNH